MTQHFLMTYKVNTEVVNISKNVDAKTVPPNKNSMMQLLVVRISIIAKSLTHAKGVPFFPTGRFSDTKLSESALGLTGKHNS